MITETSHGADCGSYPDCAECARREGALYEYEADVRVTVTALADAIGSAGQGISAARQALGDLVQLYDIETVEGPVRDDLEYELDAACRALRNAERIVKIRMAMFAPSPAGGASEAAADLTSAGGERPLASAAGPGGTAAA